ncbi:MAG TPA: helix-turn-helix domain-containing protein [Candidatus Angelobacter sp.]
MPRKADPRLQKRILRAALRLWHARGDSGLTLRAVARAAGTTTTTVYKRFRNKEEIRLALAEHIRETLVRQITAASTVEEAYRRYLRYAQRHPREYNLMAGPLWSQVLSPGRPRPAKVWLEAQLAARFGGIAEHYEPIYYALFLLNHGTASLLTAAPAGPARKEMEQNCIALCDLLLKNVHAFRRPAATDLVPEANLLK